MSSQNFSELPIQGRRGYLLAMLKKKRIPHTSKIGAFGGQTVGHQAQTSAKGSRLLAAAANGGDLPSK